MPTCFIKKGRTSVPSVCNYGYVPLSHLTYVMGVITTTGFINRCHYRSFQGWSGGAMVLGKLPVPGRPTYLDKSRARAYCACSRCGWGLFGHFSLVYHFSFLSPYLWETAGYRLKYCLKGPLSPKQPTNQPTDHFFDKLAETLDG